MKLRLEEFFDRHTMSVHIKEKQPVYAKRGRPGHWELIKVTDDDISYDEVAEIADEILDYTENSDGESLIEDDWEQARIIQLSVPQPDGQPKNSYRIVITIPPFSNAMEITAVRPTMQKTLESYSIEPKLFDRLIERAEGILIAGSPGAGKSTFAAALAGFYADFGKIVKTIEKPRDLSVDNRITQYTMLSDDPEKTGDILLLMRPDYVLYDEVRKTKDFEVFSDLRLSGIGLVGVVHASVAIDAIQRFVSRVELGMIPSIVDTVIFIENGEIDTVLSLKMTVKVPSGMQSNDLARPVVLVNDFLNNERTVFEMFSFGEQVVVIPVNGDISLSRGKRYQEKSYPPINIEEIKKEISYIIDYDDIEVQQIGRSTIRVYMPKDYIKGFIGRGGANIREVERMLNISIDVEQTTNGYETDYNAPDAFSVRIIEDKKHFVLDLGKKYAGKNVDVMIGPQVILTVTADYTGQIRLSRKKATTKRLEKMIETADAEITARLR
jgi:ATPase